jgi:hypothetical protein
MSILQYLLLAVCVPTGLALVCRLGLMSWRTTKPVIVLMHIGLMFATLWAGYWAWIGAADLGDAGSVMAAICWIAISYRSWVQGVPDHFTRPGELGEPELHHVHGGQQ